MQLWIACTESVSNEQRPTEPFWPATLSRRDEELLTLEWCLNGDDIQKQYAQTSNNRQVHPWRGVLYQITMIIHIP
jgi:hypothetical protein